MRILIKGELKDREILRDREGEKKRQTRGREANKNNSDGKGERTYRTSIEQTRE